MSTSIAPQAPVVGSLFPDWEAKTFLEIHFRSLGFAQGFSVAWDDTAPKGVHTFYCAETPTAAGYDSCPCAWTIACDAETGAFQTTSAAFEHAHLEVPADSEGRRETVKEHREFLAEAVDDLEEKATARFDQLRKLSSYRIGLESLTGPSHSVQQQVIVWDLADGVGRKRAREFERKMRLEDHLADDYPASSTLDNPHPLQAALEPVPLLAPVKAAVASTSSTRPSTSTTSAMPALVPAIPSARSRTSPAERPPPRPRSRTGTSSSTRPEPLVFPDWWAFERAVTALATSQGFQVGMCEIEVDADVLALGCTEPGCTWRVAVAQASGAERVVVYEQTCYEHRHEPPTRKRKAVEKASVGGSTKGKGLVKADKRKKKGVSFKEPSPPPPPLSPPSASSTPHRRRQARRKTTKSPVIEDDLLDVDDKGDFLLIGKSEPDDLAYTISPIVKTSTVTEASRSYNPGPLLSSRPFLPSSTDLVPLASPFRATHPPVGTPHEPAPFYSSAEASAAATLEPASASALVGGLGGSSGETLGEESGAAASGGLELDVKGMPGAEERPAGGGAVEKDEV